MKFILSLALTVFITASLVSCNTATPQNYFDQAVLNSNMIVGFAQPWSFREMESPSAGMNDKGEVVPQTRQEAIRSKIDFINNAYEKVKALKETAETKEMLQASKAVYEYVLPVYKKEYMEVAKLYDSNASKEKTDQQASEITIKYAAEFTELYDKLIATGKLYAAKNNIKVNWAD